MNTIHNFIDNHKFPDQVTLYQQIAQYNWKLNKDIPLLWDRWAKEQSLRPAGFRNVENMRYFDRYFDIISVYYYIINVNVGIKYNNQVIETTINDTQPLVVQQDIDLEQSFSDKKEYEMVKKLKFPYSIHKLKEIKSDTLVKCKTISSKNFSNLREKMLNQLQLFIHTIMPQNYEQLDIQINYQNFDLGEHEFVLKVDYYAQRYIYKSSLRIILCNSVTGEIDGDAPQSKALKFLNAIFH